jgi:hypothetical protein
MGIGAIWILFIKIGIEPGSALPKNYLKNENKAACTGSADAFVRKAGNRHTQVPQEMPGTRVPFIAGEGARPPGIGPPLLTINRHTNPLDSAKS